MCRQPSSLKVQKISMNSRGQCLLGFLVVQETANPEFLKVDGGTSSSVNIISAYSNYNDYVQLNIKNKNTGTSASSDFVATADIGQEGANYIDLGINSSIYNVPEYTAYKANDGYLYCVGGNLVLNAETTGKKVSVAVGGTLEENIVASFTEEGLVLRDHYQITNRPEVFYGTGEPPVATGLTNGTLFIKYTE